MGNLRQETSLIDKLKKRKQMIEDMANEVGEPGAVADRQTGGAYSEEMKRRAAKEIADKPWYAPWKW
jgi:hypothetical protein